ncbi:hypothetical protein CGLO_18152 [Colletotrichum gloeosporioides Cg-14]|uniref:Uncharacterized protein n=1 Tax=Colletotrichum gloeosporioides (strain Cg-14) TaxID=1237896 RepID=T0JV21_COLGC|nr:hypothetical protein CGLO_18152 [Colletotrichum gloeosporioides Cg-14]
MDAKLLVKLSNLLPAKPFKGSFSNAG